MPFSLSRYRLLKFLIPFFLGFYLFMVWLKPVIGVTHDEIFPFFSWLLFAHTPGWYAEESALIVHSIDGAPVSGTRYLIPNRDIRDQKALKSTVKDCRRLSGCDKAVKQRLYPIVNRLARGKDVEFSIIKARIDLREVQRGIGSLAKGEEKRTDFFRPDRFIGRWTTGGGRVWVSNWDGDYESADLLLRSHFDVYRSGNSVIYVRDSCSEADLDARFILHVWPVDVNDLPTDPLWPVSLLMDTTGVGWLANVTFISVAGSLVALLAVIFPGALVWRFGVFLYLFLAVAVQNSYGSINHGFHFYLFISFALLFLPPAAGHPERMVRKSAMACIAVFWFVQSLVLLSYSLAGFWKVLYSNTELFAPDGMTRILLARLMSDARPVPPLLPLVASQEYLTQLMFLVTVYAEFFAIFALFRPHLHRPFGIVLILFHLGSDWLLGVFASSHIVFLGLFMVFSPLAPARFSFSSLAQSLPLLGIPFRLWSNRRRGGPRAY